LFDRIEVWAVDRQQIPIGSGGVDRLAYARDLMRANIILDDNVSRGEVRHQHLLNVRHEQRTIDGTVANKEHDEPGPAQASNAGRGVPMAVGRRAHHALAALCPTHRSRHGGLGPGLIDEDQPGGIQVELAFSPVFPFRQSMPPPVHQPETHE
jgi:hypothetical protein